MPIGNGKAEREQPTMIPVVEIKLDRPRNLKFDMQAVFDAEVLYSERRKSGKNYSFHDMLIEGTSMGMACLLWAGLRHEDPELTLDQVGTMFRPYDINRISLAIHKATITQVDPAEEDIDKERLAEQKKTDSQPKTGETTGDDSGHSL